MAEERPSRARRLLLGAALLAPLAAITLAKPRARSGAHDEYFRALQEALARAGLFRPTLVIDRERLDHNIARLKSHLPRSKAYRIVAKSLPSLKLIDYVRSATGTDRLMVFHQPFINLVAERMPDARLLLGKPMPVGAAERFFANHQNMDFDPSRQIEWLVDTPARIGEYRELAQALRGHGLSGLRLNLEIDVGLHRGGFTRAQDVAEALRVITADPGLEFSGFMGYEAHASKIPGFLGGPAGALEKSKTFYAQCLDAAQKALGGFDADTLTLNMGGSSTYQLYDEGGPCNELAMGSGLVMPTDFDRPTLADHVPAAFIATPVLKALDRTELPGLESFAGALRAWDPNTARAFYIYGGYWYADAVSPPGLQRNAIWGHSSNQELLNGSRDVQLAVNDHVFLRPHQSEFVFLQFGDIAVYHQGDIVEQWPVFSQGA